MISLKNQEVENERKSIYGLQTNLKKMWDNIYNVSEYRSKVRKKQERNFSVLYTDSNTGATM